MEKDSLKRLFDSGLLFEINRSILHPYGMALTLVWNGDDTSGEPDSVILSSTKDPDGIIFTPDSFTSGMSKLSSFMEKEGNELLRNRYNALGFVVQQKADTP